MDGDPTRRQTLLEPSRGRTGTWLVVGILLMLLALAMALAYVGWGMGDNDDPAAAMSSGGYVAMTFGIIATLALGVGLMGLIFYSSRHGRDF